MTQVWSVFHRAWRRFNDVAVSSTRADDPVEWDRAIAKAEGNAKVCAAETVRWLEIVDELRAARP